jgi:DNA invertase Pin-like site-specific DNA recombinase
MLVASQAYILEKMPMRIFIYTRTSTAQQNDGLDAQQATCRSYLTNLAQQDQWRRRFQPCLSANGTLLVEVLREQISGSVAFAKRPVGGALLARLQTGDHLCIAKLDRAFRSARDCHNTLAVLRERGVSTSVCDLPDGADVTGNGIAALLIGIMASVAEWERERIRERTAEQKRLAKEQGRYLGGHRPWEKRVERGKLVDDPKKVFVVGKIRKWRADGVPLRTIVERVGKTGFTISTDAVRRLTENVPNAVRTRGRRKRVESDGSTDVENDGGGRMWMRPMPQSAA